MDIDEVIQLAAESKAAALIEQIESGATDYETVMAELRGSGS